MSRWEPDAPGRLEEAALDLFTEQGYDATTVEDIAARAGVTKRTFFRHYGDKREVLFSGSAQFEVAVVARVAEVPAEVPPLEAATLALDAVTDALHDRAAWARRRQAVIERTPALQEREQGKLGAVAVALAAGLRDRGVPEPDATVAAETALALFRAAFARWAADPQGADLGGLLRESARTLQAVASPR